MRHVFYCCLTRLTSAALVLFLFLQVQATPPKISGDDLVINGESFFAAANTRDELSRLAREDGVLDGGDKFKMVAVSGAPLSSIISQYKGCNPKPTYLISDGAGIDLMNTGDMTKLGNQLKDYLEEMRKGGTKKLLWMIYPDPQGGSWATLKKNQDLWAVEVPKILKDVKEPEVYLVDLRETWDGHYSEYTSDGIHQTNAGGTATAEAFWEVMKADDYAFFRLETKPDTTDTTTQDTTKQDTTQQQGNGKPTGLKGSDLLCNGESFFAASNICSELTRLAREDGILPNGENFKQAAVSGAPLASIINQYKNHNPKPTYLVSDGAGIDLMSSSDVQGLGNKLKDYLEEMRKSGTKKLLWMIYPDPQGGNWATLKRNQDLWAEEVPKIMADVEEPEVYLVDLRETWDGHYSEYTSDGIHCTNAGGTATAEAFWEVMKANNYAFFDTMPPVGIQEYEKTLEKTDVASFAVAGRVVKNGGISVSLSDVHSQPVSLRLTTVSGRSVVSVQRTTVNGAQSVMFPVGSLARGMYCCEIRAGGLVRRSTVFVP